MRPLSASVAGCIAAARVDTQPEKGNAPISVAGHDRLGEHCGLNAGKEQASRFSLPALAMSRAWRASGCSSSRICEAAMKKTRRSELALTENIGRTR